MTTTGWNDLAPTARRIRLFPLSRSFSRPATTLVDSQRRTPDQSDGLRWAGALASLFSFVLPEQSAVAQMRRSLAWTIMLISVVGMLAGCGGTSGAQPQTVVADPRAYAIEALQTMDLNAWWQVYRNTDPEVLGRIVDEVAARQPEGLPSDARRLDTFIRTRIVPSYRLYMDDTDAGKAFILAQAEARFANPPMAVWDAAGNYALLDYASLPGEWRPVTRVSEGLAHPPALGVQPFLTPTVLADSLQQLVTTYPEARVYQIRYQYHFGSQLKKMLIEFLPDQQIVYRLDGAIIFTRDQVVWDDLLNGRIELADLEWDAPLEGYEAPPIKYPPDEPLPSQL